jgi:hypothetical protein
VHTAGSEDTADTAGSDIRSGADIADSVGIVGAVAVLAEDIDLDLAGRCSKYHHIDNLSNPDIKVRHPSTILWIFNNSSHDPSTMFTLTFRHGTALIPSPLAMEFIPILPVASAAGWFSSGTMVPELLAHTIR